MTDGGTNLAGKPALAPRHPLVHHALRLHNRRGGRGVTYIPAIRTDILHGRCLLQSVLDFIAKNGLYPSGYINIRSCFAEC
jgi:hypothetical protein